MSSQVCAKLHSTVICTAFHLRMSSSIVIASFFTYKSVVSRPLSRLSTRFHLLYLLPCLSPSSFLVRLIHQNEHKGPNDSPSKLLWWPHHLYRTPFCALLLR